jgi:hypothetical protein
MMMFDGDRHLPTKAIFTLECKRLGGWCLIGVGFLQMVMARQGGQGWCIGQGEKPNPKSVVTKKTNCLKSPFFP